MRRGRGEAGPADAGRAVPCQRTGLSSGPGTACSLGLGQLGPACHWAVPCSCRAKKAGFVPCRRASGCIDIYTSRVSSVITLESSGWFVYWGLGYCGVKSPTCRAREALEEAGYVQLPTTHASICRASLHRIYRST